MKLFHEAPQRTAFHDLYDKMTPIQRRVAFFLGAIMVVFVIVFSSVHMFLYLFHAGPEHDHALLDVTFIGWMIVQFLMGSSLMMPSQTLALIAIIPLPPFLRRGAAGLSGSHPMPAPVEYGGPERRTRPDEGPPAGTDERRDPWPDEEGQ